MRKLLLILLLIPRTILAVETPNSGFESANADTPPGVPPMPANWTTDIYNGTLNEPVQATFTWLTTGHKGRSARIDVKTNPTGDGDAKWLAPFSPPDGKSTLYELSDWYRSDVETQLSLEVMDPDGKIHFYEGLPVPPAANWTQFTTTVKIPADSASKVRLMHRIQKPGFLEMDDVSCKGLNDDGVPLPPKYKATVSFTFDDGWLSAYNMLVPRLDKKGWQATHFIITTYPDKPGYQSDYILSKHIKSLVARGHEVCAHTLTHPNLTTLKPEDWTNEVVDPIASLKSWGGTAGGIAPPFGAYNPQIQDLMAQHYAYMRTLDNFEMYPPYNIHGLHGHVMTNLSTVQELDELLNRAEQKEGGWIVLVFHRAGPALDPTAPGVEAFVEPDTFQKFLELIEQHGAKVETMGQHLGLFTPVVQPVTPPVIGDKSFEAPEKVDKAGKEVPPEMAGDGCSAQPGRHPLQGLWLLAGALVLLTRRRLQQN